MPNEHESWMDELMRVAGNLSEAEVRTLVDQAQRKQDTLTSAEAPTLDTPAPRKPMTTSAASEAATEELGGRYKLLERIGEGGFGTVYVAEQSEPVRRRVAVKILKRGMDTENVVARFDAERQALALMDHPNIARVIDAGTTQNGLPFFVMELVRGVPITEFCDNGALPMKERVALLRTVCGAVQHAHQKGIIHRDLKPSNILVTLQDGEPVPKVIDFGIAKAVHGRLAKETVYTQVHQMVGTPGYMSPEQAGASTLDVDTRTDVYSLGVIAYELFTGASPFDEFMFRGASLGEIQRIIAEEPIPRPSARFAANEDRRALARARSTEPARLERLLRGDLDWIVLRCLERDRTRRYSSTFGLDDDLGRYLANEPVKAGPPSLAYLARKFVSRHRASVLFSAAAILLLWAGLAGSLLGWSRARDQSEQLRFTLDFFTQALAGGADADAGLALWQERPDLTLGEALADAEPRIAETFEDQPELEATIRELVGLSQLRAAEYRSAALQLSQVAALREQSIGAQDPALLRVLLPLADARSKMGDFDAAMDAGRTAHERSVTALGERHATSRSAALWLARWHAAAYDFEDAERYFELATLRVGTVPDTRDAITLTATIESCAVLIGHGHADRAVELLRAVLPSVDDLDAADQVRARLHRLLGLALLVRSRPDEAIEVLGVTLLPDGSLPRNADPFSVRLLGWALAEKGEFDHAQRVFEGLLDQVTGSAPPHREVFARVYYADALIAADRPEEALVQIRNALERYDALGFPTDPDRLWASSILGMALLGTGEVDEASRAIEHASRLTSMYPEHRMYVPVIAFAEASLLRAKGETERAEQEFERAVRAAEQVRGPASPSLKRMRERWADGSS